MWPVCSRDLCTAVGSPIKEVQIYKGGRHNLLIERKEIRDGVLQNQLEWMDKRILDANIKRENYP